MIQKFDPTSKDPVVSNLNILCIQVCVPENWTDKQALEFAEKENPCGTRGGWHMRRNGDKLLMGDPERRPCDEREGFVHIMFDA